MPATRLKKPRRAVLDVGTNSVLLLVAELTEDGSPKIIKQFYRVSRLGEGLRKSGSLQPKPMQRTVKAIVECLDVARDEGAEQVLVIGTEALRSAGNREDFKKLLRQECGCTLKIVSAEEEARLTFRGSIQDIPGKEYCVIDVGGGSSEVVCGDGGHLFHHVSRQIGVVFLAEQAGMPEKLDEALKQSVEQRILAAFADATELKGFGPSSTWIGAGGTLSLLAILDQDLEEYDPAKVHGYTFTQARLLEWYDRLNQVSPATRLEWGVEKGREDVLLFGILIFSTLMEQGAAREIAATDRGLRFGALYEDALFEPFSRN